MNFDFTADAAHRLADTSAAGPATSTELARSYGLEGEWTACPGAELVVAALESARRPWFSRLANPRFTAGWHASQVLPIPGVAGQTAWPDGAGSLVLVEQPNHVGGSEDLVEAADHGPLAVMLRPGLAGDVQLPPSTIAVLFDLGADTISIAPGAPSSLTRIAAATAALSRHDRRHRADEARRSARRLVKMASQLRGVSAPNGPPSTGRFVLSTPRAPDSVLAVMVAQGVAGGEPVLLPEYPGGIVVTCRAGLDDTALSGFVAALTAALS